MPSSSFLARVLVIGVSGVVVVACTGVLGQVTIDDTRTDGGGTEGGTSQADGGGTATDDGGGTAVDSGSGGGKVDSGPPAPCLPNSKPFRFAFVTSELVTGNLVAGTGVAQGIAAANKRCTAAAAAANLPGAYVAFLSDSTGTEPGQDFLMGNGGAAAPPLFLPPSKNGSCIAVLSNPASYKGSLDHAIDHDQFGQVVTAGPVWTATKPDGTYIGSTAVESTCVNWLDPGDGGVAKGGVGNSGAKDSTWTQSATQSCANHGRLYCVQM